MRIIATFLALGVAAFASASEQSDDVRVASLQVKEQLQTIELINVTAEKPIDADAPAPDAELQQILDEVDALEQSEE